MFEPNAPSTSKIREEEENPFSNTEENKVLTVKPVSLVGFFKLKPKELLSKEELQRQNQFVNTILQADLEKVKKLVLDGASLTDPNQHGMYPLIAGAYSCNLDMLKYIEAGLENDDKVFWRQIDLKQFEDYLSNLTPGLRPEDSTFKWLGSWFSKNKDRPWCKKYDEIILKIEQVNGWGSEWKSRFLFGCTKEFGLNWFSRGFTYLTGPWTERMIGDTDKKLLYAPRADNHDKVITIIITQLEELKTYCLNKINTAQENISNGM